MTNRWAHVLGLSERYEREMANLIGKKMAAAVGLRAERRGWFQCQGLSQKMTGGKE